MSSDNENARPLNVADQLDPDKIASVSSAGVSVTLRGPGDDKAALEAENLKVGQRYNPLASCFSANKWGNMRQ